MMIVLKILNQSYYICLQLNGDKMLKFNSISRMYFFSSLIMICLLTFSLAYYLLKSKYEDFVVQSKLQEIKLLEYQKQLLESEVDRSISFIDYKKSLLHNKLKSDLAEKVNEVLSLVDTIYHKNRNRKSLPEIKNIVKETLRPLRYNHGEGYYFAGSLDGIIQLYPTHRERENTNALDLQDSHGNYAVLDEIQLAKESAAGYLTHYWPKPGDKSGQSYLKTSYIKLFKPFNWYIGTGKYIDDVEMEMQSEVLEYFHNIKFGKTSEDCLIIVESAEPDKKPLVGKIKFMPVSVGIIHNMQDSISSRHKSELTRQLNLFGQGFVKYEDSFNPQKSPKTKIVYFKKYTGWNWTIGAVLDVSDLYAALEDAKKNMQHKLIRELIFILLITFFFFALTAVFSWVVSRDIEREFTVFANFFNNAANDNRMLNVANLYIKEFKYLAEALNLMIYKRDTAERRLVENEKTFRSFMDHADEFMIIKDLEGRYVIVNQKFKEILNLDYKDIIGKRPEELGYDPKAAELMYAVEQSVINTRHSLTQERASLKSKSIGIEWLEEIIFPIFDTQENIKYIGILSRDISERKKADNNIAIQQEQLKKAYQELQQSQEIVIRQEKLASLGTMIAGIAHEINNPAQAIEFSLTGLQLNIDDLHEIIMELRNLPDLNSAELENALQNLQKLLETKQIDEVFQEISSVVKDNKNSVSRISKIIQNIKRLVHNNIELTDCSINEIINDSVSLVKNQIKNQITIQTDLAQSLPPLFGSSQELGQVFINMLLNASDAVSEKGLKQSEGFVRIKTEFLHSEQMLQITVQDNGNGIKEDLVEKIFDPFLTTKPVGKGTGLGLYISYQIIENHNGKISVTSRHGEGTEFKIFLPQKENKNSV